MARPAPGGTRGRSGRLRTPVSRPRPWRRGEWRGAVPLLILAALLITCALGGGSAFADTFSLLYVRPVAVIALIALLLVPGGADWRAVRAPLAMLGLLAAIMALQLVPLPPALWMSLPARAPYATIATAAGLAEPWRPLSLTPDLTANSLAALVIPAAALVGFARITPEQRRWAVVGLVILCAISAGLGVAQFASGKGSSLYLYKRTHDGFPVGLLANRNHQAALLALIFPALRVWTLQPAERAWAQRRQWLALALGGLTVPVLLATGSRAGIAIGAASVALTLLAFPVRYGSTRSRRTIWLYRFGVPALLLVLVLLSYSLGRAVSIERFSSLSVEADQRVQFAPVVLAITRASFPVGTGFGSFDPVFRQYEPDAFLIASYFNHAHNELLELAMTAGLPGLLLLAAFLFWWIARVLTAIRSGTRHDPERSVALLGGMIVGILFAASLVDYPLRTPLMSAVFAIGCGWLGARPARR